MDYLPIFTCSQAKHRLLKMGKFHIFMDLQMNYLPLVLVVALAAGGCSKHVTQNSSGADFISGFQGNTQIAGTPFQDFIRQAARTEPILKLPAKIGIARIGGGRFSDIPADESELWAEIARNGPSFGTFIEINALLVKSVRDELTYKKTSAAGHDPFSVVSNIRLAAARQHVDAVLIYSVDAETRKNKNVLAVTDFTLLGGGLFPSRTIDSVGSANAILLDVRNGYPYGTASASSKKAAFSTWWGASSRKRNAHDEAQRAAARKLIPEVGKMFVAVANSKRNRAGRTN